MKCNFSEIAILSFSQYILGHAIVCIFNTMVRAMVMLETDESEPIDETWQEVYKGIKHVHQKQNMSGTRISRTFLSTPFNFYLS